LVALRRTHLSAGFRLDGHRPLGLGSHSVAIAFEVEDVAAVEKSIEHGAGKCGVAEDLAPVAEGLIARNNRRSFFVALADELEEQVAAALSNST
jgi:hypothetical protein